MNCLAVETEGRLLIVDCGVMFSNDSLGIDLMHPGFEYLVERRDDIEGVILTHAHEDHLAGLPFLLREIDVPIYGGTYALGLLNAKMAEAEYTPQLMARPLHLHKSVTLGPFSVSSFPMPHSIVQNSGLVIDMPKGRILHTGDFKLGMMGDGGSAALKTLGKAAEGGIDLMLADSTGAEELDVAGEESHVATTIERFIRETEHRVFVAIFSSNIQRMEAVIRAAVNNGRKVALCGRSVQNHLRIARATYGMGVPPDAIVPMEEAASLPRQEVVFIVSGTQGEGRSALSRIANGNHHVLTVDPGDLVILSSRFIPGNEIAISKMIDQLLMKRTRVVHRGILGQIHVSGHGGKQEIAAAVRAVKPRCYLPVHGTYRHLVAGAALAETEGIDNVAVAVNGQFVRISDAGIAVEERPMPIRRVFVDRGGSLSESAVKDRRILGSNGLLVVTLTLDKAGHLGGDIDVVARGVVSNELLPWFGGIIRDKVIELISSLDDEACDDDICVCREIVRSGLRKFLNKQVSREPLVLVSVLRI
jgi:ribonuclease J